MSRVGFRSILLAFLAVAPAAAQDWSLESRVPAEVLAAVQPILEAARTDSLPVAALESKVLEGVAKGVGAARIAVALSALADEFRTARSVLRASLPAAPLADGEVVSASLAIRQGVTAEGLAALWEHRTEGQTLEIPLAVTGELARRGIEPAEAVDLMSHILSSETPLSTAAQIPTRLDLLLPGAGAPQAALLEALRSLGIPIPSRGPRGPGGPSSGR